MFLFLNHCHADYFNVLHSSPVTILLTYSMGAIWSGSTPGDLQCFKKKEKCGFSRTRLNGSSFHSLDPCFWYFKDMEHLLPPIKFFWMLWFICSLLYPWRLLLLGTGTFQWATVILVLVKKKSFLVEKVCMHYSEV